jgi:hypothetical protein
MSRGSAVVVKRHGFLAATAYGLFGTLTALIICSAGVGVYALHVLDAKTDRLLNAGAGLITSLPQLRESMPPVVADMINDRRSPAYREHVELACRMVAPSEAHGRDMVVIEVTNNGAETITLMGVRVVLVDAAGVPVRAMSTYAATPAMIDDDWRGPLLPGSTRQCSFNLYSSWVPLRPVAEITDLRVWSESDKNGSSDGQTVSQQEPT